METKQNVEMKKKNGEVRKIVTALIVIVVIATLVLAAYYPVSSVDVAELLKKLHGG
jgi:hypothetical protein